MPLSNNSDTVARFWRKYRNSLVKSGIKASAVKWYAHHAEAYVKASAGRRLATHSAADIEAWLGELGRIGRIRTWQFAQAVDAVRHLLVLARAPAVDAVDWKYWREAAAALPANHPTIARAMNPVPAPAARGGDAGGSGDAGARLVAVIRQRNYSIRTEEAYRGWLERFVRFIGGGDPQGAGPAEVKAFLQALAVEGRVAANTPEPGAQRAGVLLRQGARAPAR